ncbi:MAG TPA: helix-turn-helix domain-containing protein [Solirubrobacteraceae bacterium]
MSSDAAPRRGARAGPGRRRYATRQPRAVRREQILDATLRLIAQHGWPAMTMDRVAAEADIAKSVVYAIFESQAGLQHALMQREQERGYALAADALAAGRAADTPGAAVAAALATYLEGVEREPETWKLVLMPIDGAPDGVREAIREGRERWRLEMLALVEEQLGGAGIDTDLLTHLLRGSAEYLARLLLEDPKRFPRERLTKEIATIAARLTG